MKYHSVVAVRRGGPEVLQVVENELRAPEAGEARAHENEFGVEAHALLE